MRHQGEKSDDSPCYLLLLLYSIVYYLKYMGNLIELACEVCHLAQSIKRASLWVKDLKGPF